MNIHANFDAESALNIEDRKTSCEIVFTEEFLIYYSDDTIVNFIIAEIFEHIENTFLTSALLPPHQLRSHLKPFCSDKLELNDETVTFQYYWASNGPEGILTIDKPSHKVFFTNTQKDLSKEVLQIS